MLTLAALCLQHDTKHTPDQALKYLQTAEYYGEQFVAQASRQLHEMKPGDSDVNLACARLLTVLGFGFFRVHQHSNLVSITDEPAWTWLHLLRGTSTVHTYYQDSDERVNNTMACDLEPEDKDTSIDANWYRTRLRFELHPQFQYIQSTRHKRFTALNEALAERALILNPTQVADLRAAIDVLEHVTETTCCGEVHSLMRILGTVSALLTKGFVSMLSSGNLFALAIHAHWLMLVVLTDQVWWMDDMGVHGMREIIALCEAEPTAGLERSLLEWPRQMLSAMEYKGDMFDFDDQYCVDYDSVWGMGSDPLGIF